MLEWAVFNLLSAYLSQYNLLHPNQSDFKANSPTKMVQLVVTEALHAARADSVPSVLILLRPVPCVWHSNPTDPPLKKWLSQTLHSSCLHPTWQVGIMKWHEYTVCLTTGPSLLLHLRKDACCNNLTWLLRSLICWWHPAFLSFPSSGPEVEEALLLVWLTLESRYKVTILSSTWTSLSFCS